MAGDWIKMRTNLWDDPRVSRLCDITGQPEAAIIGGLYWLWSAADEHTEDGVMPGLSLAGIDRKTGIKGLGEALSSIGWIADAPEGVRIVRFEEHNGASAKRRCSESRRKMSARDADSERTQSGISAEELQNDCAPREREEKEEEGKPVVLASASSETPRGTTAGEVCSRLRKAGIASVNPSHPRLLALLEAGLTADEIVSVAQEPSAKGKGFAWVLAAAEGRRRDAAAVGNLPSARASPATLGERNRQAAEQAKEMIFGQGGQHAAG